MVARRGWRCGSFSVMADVGAGIIGLSGVAARGSRGWRDRLWGALLGAWLSGCWAKRSWAKRSWAKRNPEWLGAERSAGHFGGRHPAPATAAPAVATLGLCFPVRASLRITRGFPAGQDGRHYRTIFRIWPISRVMTASPADDVPRSPLPRKPGASAGLARQWPRPRRLPLPRPRNETPLSAPWKVVEPGFHYRRGATRMPRLHQQLPSAALAPRLGGFQDRAAFRTGRRPGPPWRGTSRESVLLRHAPFPAPRTTRRGRRA